jgi:lipoprotein signal peptidase
MSDRKRVLMVLLILVLGIGLDHASKYLAKSYLPRNRVIALAGTHLKLDYSVNRGGSFSFE